jgi:8-oxo-dGTP diphosphatase
MQKKLIEDILQDVEDVEEIKVITSAIIGRINEHGEKQILLVQRSINDFAPLHYELPGGGVDQGEEIEETIIREVYEETNLTVVIHDLLEEIEYVSHGGKKITHKFIFLCLLDENVPDQEVQLSHEHDDYKWVGTFAEVEHLISDSDIKRNIAKVFQPQNKIVNYDLSEYLRQIQRN